jgi:hypothetical protein
MDRALSNRAAEFYKTSASHFESAGDLLAAGKLDAARAELFNGRKYLSAGNQLLKLANQTVASSELGE